MNSSRELISLIHILYHIMNSYYEAKFLKVIFLIKANCCQIRLKKMRIIPKFRLLSPNSTSTILLAFAIPFLVFLQIPVLSDPHLHTFISVLSHLQST